MNSSVRLTLIHHANQYLLTEGYLNRDGFSQIVQGYAGVLAAHEHHKIPCGLHLSGTLIEAIAWHCPWFFPLVKRLQENGWVDFIGGTYSENIMPLCDADSNRRQLREYLTLFDRHIGDGSQLKWFWVPERMWNTETLSPIIADPSLQNGGYRGVFLDGRLLFPVARESDGLTRSDVDGLGPWNKSNDLLSTQLEKLSPDKLNAWLEQLQIHALPDRHGIQVAPISEHLRYWIPFRSGDQERLIDLGQIARIAPQNSPTLVFADDLERVAGVAGWDTSGLSRYNQFLEWVAGRSEFLVVPPSLHDRPKIIEKIDSGSFFELECDLLAGVDGAGFCNTPEAVRAKSLLAQSLRAVSDLTHACEPRLTDLAWKHVLASQYETLWHDKCQYESKTAIQLAPWAEALASHSRHALVIAEAAKWFSSKDRLPRIDARDFDCDGENEIAVMNQNIFALFAPRHGGRLVALFYFAGNGAAMMVGNPSDDWNWQCELNQFMKVPANHPGAFCDSRGENEHYEIVHMNSDRNSVEFCMQNAELGSAWHGTRKTILLASDSCTLAVDYHLPRTKVGEITISLSPDYLSLLREGSVGANVTSGPLGFNVARAGVAVALNIRSGALANTAGTIGHGWKFALTELEQDVRMELECLTV